MQRERKALQTRQWPDQDLTLWRRGTSPVGLFEPGNAGYRWSTRSRVKIENGYARWLGWLRATEHLDMSAHPADRVQRETVARYINDLGAQCSSYTVANRVQELYDAMRAIAPCRDWSWLRALHERLYARAQPVIDKRGRLRPAGELVRLGRKLIVRRRMI